MLSRVVAPRGATSRLPSTPFTTPIMRSQRLLRTAPAVARTRSATCRRKRKSEHAMPFVAGGRAQGAADAPRPARVQQQARRRPAGGCSGRWIRGSSTQRRHARHMPAPASAHAASSPVSALRGLGSCSSSESKAAAAAGAVGARTSPAAGQKAHAVSATARPQGSRATAPGDEECRPRALSGQAAHARSCARSAGQVACTGTQSAPLRRAYDRSALRKPDAAGATHRRVRAPSQRVH